MNDHINEINQWLNALRDKAEEKFNYDVPSNKSILIPVDLLHELRVHQIELEMQNEELRRAQAALETYEAHYVDLYDFAPVGYLTLNAEGMVTEINLTAAKLLGMERSDIINRRFERFVTDNYKDLWCRHFLRAKQIGVAQGCELSFRSKIGAILYYHLDCLYLDKDGEPPFMRITLSDVTQRKQAEEALRIAAAAFETHDCIVITDSNRIILRVNQAFTRITGYNPEDVIGQTPYLLRSQLHGEDFYESIWEYVNRDGFWQGEVWDKRKNGEVFLIWLSITAVADTDGQISHYVGLFMDVTGRKQAEEALRIAAVAFKTQAGIIITDANETILRVNKAFTRITGYSAEEVAGKTPAILRSGIHRHDFFEALWATVNGDGHWEGEIWDKHKNGTVFPLWQSITAVTDPDGKITHYVGSFMDITALKQAEKVLLEARSRLQNEVLTTQEELEKHKQETAEVNTALNILLKHREADITEAQIALSNEIKATVMPLIKSLKGLAGRQGDAGRLVTILEGNLELLMKSYGHAANLSVAYQKLTPIEIQVASMIRQGQPTKVIAQALNIAPGTVSIHRKHIRKKFGLDGKSDNLSVYLQGLGE
jgi:PAS domain S-box-containing protein